MHYTPLPQATAKRLYNVHCRPMPGVDVAPQVHATHCTISVAQSSVAHGHHETEAFLILEGQGSVTASRQTQPVRPGDYVRFDAFEEHEIRNVGDTDLRYVSLVWVDPLAVDAPPRQHDTRRLVLQSTPPTPNGDLHLGHLAGPFIAVDAMRRYYLARGVDAAHVCGRDDHQSYVLKRGLDQGRTALEVADDYSARMVQSFARADIAIDYFSEPQRSPWHQAMTRSLFHDLVERGFIVERETEALYCAETGRYLHEALVCGTCPHCHAPTDGNNCEACGRPNRISDLIEPRSKLSASGAVERRPLKRLFFQIDRVRERLVHYHAGARKSNRAAAFCSSMLSEPMDEVCVSHVTDWGTRVGLPGYEDQCIFSYFEVAVGYLAAAQGLTGEAAGADREAWRRLYDPLQSRVVHFLGFDNCFTHLLLAPAIYLAIDRPVQPPEAYVLNELLYLDGQKFSTSRNHLILAPELLRQVDVDAARYALAAIRPEESTGNFTLDYLRNTIDDTLVRRWDRWIGAVFEVVRSDFGGVAPEPGIWTDEQRALRARLVATIGECEGFYEPGGFSLRLACKAADELVVRAQRDLDAQRFFRHEASSYDAWRTSVALQLSALRTLAQVIGPVMPGFSRRLQDDLLVAPADRAWQRSPAFVPGGTPLQRPHGGYFQAAPVSLDAMKRGA